MMGLLSGITLNRAVEKPPKQFASGPTQTGKTSELLDLTPEQVVYLCNLSGTNLSNRSLAPGCYNPKTDQVIVPGKGHWPEGERQRLRDHEWAHPRGWRHNADGFGTSPDSLPPRKP